jgi:hypothetical protein
MSRSSKRALKSVPSFLHSWKQTRWQNKRTWASGGVGGYLMSSSQQSSHLGLDRLPLSQWTAFPAFLDICQCRSSCQMKKYLSIWYWMFFCLLSECIDGKKSGPKSRLNKKKKYTKRSKDDDHTNSALMMTLTTLNDRLTSFIFGLTLHSYDSRNRDRWHMPCYYAQLRTFYEVDILCICSMRSTFYLFYEVDILSVLW